MLRNLSPLLTPDLLHALRSMGHGDEIALVDGNFPAETNAQRLIRLDGIAATDVLKAVLSVMPLDTYVAWPAARMEVVGKPDEVPEICAEFQTIINSAADAPCQLGKIERFAFYERVQSCFAIVATGESRLYGNIILTKGVIRPGA
ncbi:MAG: ribose ABC transporter [Rhodospirillales bacterium]|nr:ribose ABC transporter [Rhodospirillales bacterium]